MKVPPLPPRPAGAAIVGSALVALALSGCSQGTASPAGVAEDFGAALSSGEFASACELLTPEARNELENGSREPCESALQILGVPAGGEIVQVQAWGRAAIAKMEQDTLFLARTGESWAVRAAGCTPSSNAPYDCIVTGG